MNTDQNNNKKKKKHLTFFDRFSRFLVFRIHNVTAHSVYTYQLMDLFLKSVVVPAKRAQKRIQNQTIITRTV